MEVQRLKQEFAQLYDGDPWIDVAIKPTLAGIPAEKASKKIAEGRNSIWQIVVHMIEWRQMLLKRMKGNVVPVPEDNFIREIPETSEGAWARDQQRFEESQQEWLEYFDKLKDDDLEKTYPGNGQRYYYLIQGLIQHDAYHLGQIVLLSKLGY